MVRRALVFIACLAGCHVPERGAGVPDPASLGPPRPGVTCPPDLIEDPELGCAGSRKARPSSMVITHHDEMGPGFRLEELAYAVDGQILYRYRSSDEQGPNGASPSYLPIFDGSIDPGEHEVAIKITYRGHGEGVFSYLSGYTFDVQSSCTLTAEAFRHYEVQMVAYERGGATTALEDRPAVSCKIDAGPR